MRALVFLLALGLTACASNPISELRDGDGASLERLGTVAMADLKAAEASALAHDDRFAAECWVSLQALVAHLQGRPRTEVVGVFTAFQKARNLRRGVDGVLGDRNVHVELVEVRCAHMWRDARRTILRIARLLG